MNHNHLPTPHPDWLDRIAMWGRTIAEVVFMVGFFAFVIMFGG